MLRKLQSAKELDSRSTAHIIATVYTSQPFPKQSNTKGTTRQSLNCNHEKMTSNHVPKCDRKYKRQDNYDVPHQPVATHVTIDSWWIEKGGGGSRQGFQVLDRMKEKQRIFRRITRMLTKLYETQFRLATGVNYYSLSKTTSRAIELPAEQSLTHDVRHFSTVKLDGSGRRGYYYLSPRKKPERFQA